MCCSRSSMARIFPLATPATWIRPSSSSSHRTRCTSSGRFIQMARSSGWRRLSTSASGIRSCPSLQFSRMGFMELPLVRRLWIIYKPDPDERSFMQRAQTQTDDDAEVTIAVLDSAESRRLFGVPMARHGLQPIWLRIVNRSAVPLRLHLVSLDPNYYTAMEASGVCHYSFGKRLAGFGALACLFLPLLALLPLKLIGAWRANVRMSEYFQAHAFHLRPIPPGGTSEGFVFTPVEVGTRVCDVRLLGQEITKDFVFSLPVPGLDADHLKRGFDKLYSSD